MHGIVLKEYIKGPEDLCVIDVPDPVPKDNEYLIAIYASAANFFDLLQITGKYQHQPSFPWIAGAEFAGEILLCPRSINGLPPIFKRGEKVFGSSQGSYATKIICTQDRLKPLPKHWDCAEAAGLFITAPTSYSALVHRAGVKAGDWVLVHAAAGGVGLAAVQIAKAFGATVIATAGSLHKLKIAKKFGADHTINYREKNWPDLVKKLTPDARGVDIVYDPVGLITQSTKCSAWNAKLLVLGFVGGEIEKVAMNRVLLKNISLIGLHWGMYAVHEPETVQAVWDGLFRLMEQGKFKPTCYQDKNYVGLDTVPAALKALSARETWGKVVIKIRHDGSSKL